MRKPRVGMVFVGMPLTKDGEQYTCRASIFNMLSHASRLLDIELLCPVREGREGGYRVDLTGMELHPLGGWISGLDLYGRRFLGIAIRLFMVFLRRAKTWDAIVIIDPDPLSHLAYLYARIFRTRRVLYLRGDDVFEIRKRNPRGLRGIVSGLWCGWLRFSIGHMMRHSVGVVTGSALMNRYRSHAPIPYFASAVSEAQLLKRQQAGPIRTRSAPLRLLMVGYLASYKGYDIAIEAVGLIRGRGAAVRLDIVGTGPEAERLHELAGKLGVTAIVTFHGFVPYGELLFAIYREADVFLMPSRSEGTPKVIPEAFSFGLPVIASRVGGIPDMVSDGENGILLGDITPEALASSIEGLLAATEALDRLSLGAFRSAREYTVERQLRFVIEEASARLCPGRS